MGQPIPCYFCNGENKCNVKVQYKTEDNHDSPPMKEIQDYVRNRVYFGAEHVRCKLDGYLYISELMCKECYDILARTYGLVRLNDFELNVTILKKGRYYRG